MITRLLGRAGPKSRPLAGRSYWQRHGGAASPGEVTPENYQVVDEATPKRVDFAIIGGGLAGLSAALALRDAEPGATIALLEANFLGFGASGRNAGLLGPLPAPLWLASADSEPEHLWGLGHLNKRVHEIAAWLKAVAPQSGIEPKALRIEAQGHLTATGLARVARLLGRAGLDHRGSYGPAGHLVVELDTHAVDPYRTVKALGELARQRGITIHEHTPVRAIEETPDHVQIALAGGRQIAARSAIICTNAYTGSLAIPQKIAAKVVYNFMVASSALQPERLARPGAEGHFVVELNTSYVFYRLHQNRIIYGGIERFKPYGESDFDVPPGVLAGLERLLERSFPGAGVAPAEAWSGIYHQTATDLPIIEPTGSRGAIVLNVGYGGTGVAMTLMCGRLAAAVARGNRYATPDDARLHTALRSTRIPVAGIARFISGVAADVLTLRRPAASPPGEG